MQNRRQHYRHEFAPTRPVAVALEAADAPLEIRGELINLSISGMCVYAPALKADATQKWIATLSLDAAAEPLRIEAERIYKRHEDPARCGFRFAAVDEIEALEEREKVIWKFLLDEQRRRRQFV